MAYQAFSFGDYATKKEHNDVCDFLEVLSSDEFLKILKYEIDIRHSILQNKENPFSIPIPNCYKIHIDKYIGENNRKGFYQAKPLCLLKSIIRQEKKLLLQSPTGTGKTTALIEMAFDQEFRTKLGVKRTIFFSPINPVCDQTREKIRKTFGFVPKVIDGNYSPTELDEKEPVLICTYQSCAKVMHLIKESEIIVDEGHTLIEWGFNNPYNRMILEYCNMAEKAIVISATPPLQLATQITNYCNFSFCKIIQNPKYAQKIKVFPMIYKGVEREIINSVMQLKTPDGKPIVLKKNNINMLESFQQYVKEKELLSNRLIEDIKDQKGNVYKNAEEYKSATGEDYQKKHEYGYEYGLQPLRVEIFSSKKRKYKEDNENYQTLMLTNNFKTPIDLLLVTSLFDFGINVEPEILQYFLIGFNTASSAIQLPGRSRIDHNTGKNKEINLYVFRKKRKKKKLSSTMDTMQKMEGMYNCWNANAKAANKYDHENMISLKKSEIEPIYKSQITGKYIVNTLGILQMEQSRQESFQTNEQYFQELVGNYDNVELMEVQEIKTETDPLIKEILDSKKTKRVLGKEKAFQILKEKETAKEGEFKPLLEAVYHSTSNHSLKRKIKRSVSIKKEISIDARQIAEETPEIFCNGYFDNHLNKYFKLKSMNIPTDKILPILIDLKNDSQFREFMNSLICGIEIEINKNHSNLLSGESLDRVAMYNQILKKFDPDIDKPIDIYKIYYKMRDIVGEGRYSKMNSYAIPLRELYTVNTCKQEVNTEKSKKRKRKTMYLLYKKDPFELLKANGITKEEYIKMIISNNVEVDFRKEGLL